MKKSQYAGLIIAIAILVLMNLLPASELLSRSAIHNMAILIAVIVLLITEPIPIGITCLFSIPLLVIFNVVPNVPAALSGFTNPIVFFVLASFGVSRAIIKVPLASRMLKGLIALFGKNVKTMLLVFMVVTALISSLVSNVAATAVFLAIVITLSLIHI